MWEFQPKNLIWSIVTIIIAQGTPNISPHVLFAVLCVVCGADTNFQGRREDDSAELEWPKMLSQQAKSCNELEWSARNNKTQQQNKVEF